MTKHICVINWKGGCGKTTIATHLAVALAASGLETGLADYDRQKTAKLWKKLRPKNAVAVSLVDLAQKFRQVSRVSSAHGRRLPTFSQDQARAGHYRRKRCRYRPAVALNLRRNGDAALSQNASRQSSPCDRDVLTGQDCLSPARHSAFSTPVEMMQFIAELRGLSGGKPTGFKLCVGHPWEFLAVVKAMLKTGITPDFIVIDGTEGGTGAAPLEFMDHMGMPLRDGLTFVHAALVGTNMRDKIKLGASGKITSAFDMARVMALGADWCNAARGFMFAVGCIQSQQCHTDRCPTGVATQDPIRQRAVVLSDKGARVASFHKETVKALGELVAAAGLDHPRELRSHHFVRRASDATVTFMELYRCLEPGELLTGTSDTRFKESWAMARAESFAPTLDKTSDAAPLAAE